MSASWRPPPTPSSYLTANSIAATRLKYEPVERLPRAGRHSRRLARHAGDGVDRMAEQVAVVDAGAAAERPHRLAQLGLRRACRRRPPAALGRGSPRAARSSTVSTRGWRISSNSCSGNCASSACDQRDGGLAGRVRDRRAARRSGSRPSREGNRRAPQVRLRRLPAFLTPDPPGERACGGARTAYSLDDRDVQFACGGGRSSFLRGPFRATFSDQRGICEKSPSRPSASRTSSSSRSRFARTAGPRPSRARRRRSARRRRERARPTRATRATLAVDRDLAQLHGQRALRVLLAAGRGRPLGRVAAALPASRCARVYAV